MQLARHIGKSADDSNECNASMELRRDSAISLDVPISRANWELFGFVDTIDYT